MKQENKRKEKKRGKAHWAEFHSLAAHSTALHTHRAAHYSYPFLFIPQCLYRVGLCVQQFCVTVGWAFFVVLLP
jgi:hypothetical protein